MGRTTQGTNNPRRALAETVSLIAWQSEFDGKTALADLFIDVTFDEGRIGGEDAGAPVRFRLSLRQAEVHINRDLAGVLNFPPAHLARRQPTTGTRTKTVERKGTIKGNIDGSMSFTGLSGGVGGAAAGEVAFADKAELTQPVATMEVTHRATADGYAFVIRPRSGDRLEGPAWSTELPKAKIHDSGHKRKRGEPPDVRVELRCRREDLIIENVEFVDSQALPFWKLDRAKQVAIEQYLKEELSRVGFDVGTLSEPFAQLILADVTPERTPTGDDD